MFLLRTKLTTFRMLFTLEKYFAITDNIHVWWVTMPLQVTMSSLRPRGVVFDPVAATHQLGDLTTGKVLKQFGINSYIFPFLGRAFDNNCVCCYACDNSGINNNKSLIALSASWHQFPVSQLPPSAILVFVELGDWRQSSILSRWYMRAAQYFLSIWHFSSPRP